ncbi:MFS transporter [Thermogymnomonas acidicola]|uniref:MFS transporter n=1 Tax=Thermogymnomonas acidicola TaxID=399579 RepID=UPI0014946A67|nr:MFS transporter [Thermogymnomonas acidicola]
MGGVILAIAPLVTTWYFIPPSADEYILIASPVGLLLGNYIMGLLSDRFGRKPAYVLTLVPTAVGLLLITLSFSWLPIAIGIFLSEFGIGGDETVSLSLMGEMLPLRHRGEGYCVNIEHCKHLDHAHLTPVPAAAQGIIISLCGEGDLRGGHGRGLPCNSHRKQVLPPGEREVGVPEQER